MVTVKLFGLLRLDSGIKEFVSEAATVKELYEELKQLAAERGNIITDKNIKSCALLVNGQQADKNIKFKDGDQVIFMSMVAGG
ncbi:MAG: MoaD/ThiS family protein [Oscillospiraceae bacterium]|nr:MoaD/ThiS family protein [Oscillospiraceae bacterium]